jgi:electron transfer flavoprotein alpha subunit
MKEIMIFIEHRAGSVREVSTQILSKADELCRLLSADLCAVVVCGDSSFLAGDFLKRADTFLVMEDKAPGDFNSQTALDLLARLIKERSPLAVLMGHTPWGMDLGPALAVRTGLPLATDCVDLILDDGRIKAVRQLYGGKVFARIAFPSQPCVITVRPGSFQAAQNPQRRGELVKIDSAGVPSGQKGVFVEYIDTAAGETDISQAELLVSIGRGVGERERIDEIRELAEMMGGVLSCSRPVVDKGWLPKFHQVGTSGKSVKPKVYLALGISGAFQHVAGIAGAGTVIAVNKDKKAPIFRVAHYGVADDLFSITEALKKALRK